MKLLRNLTYALKLEKIETSYRAFTPVKCVRNCSIRKKLLADSGNGSAYST